jgi:hypothetical protein
MMNHLTFLNHQQLYKMSMNSRQTCAFVLFAIPLFRWMGWASVWLCVGLMACREEVFPEYKPKPAVLTRRLNFIFIDKSDPTANIAIYLNDRLLKDEIRSFRGLQQVDISDSLFSRTASLALAEFEGINPPDTLRVQDLIYETFIIPSELDSVRTVTMIRNNVASPIVLSKSGIGPSEVAPTEGHFKIRFFNLTTSRVNVFRRNGKAFAAFANLDLAEERAYTELPFGPYRFLVRKQGQEGTLGAFSPVVRGEAGKVYNVLCTDEGQVVTEVGDFGSSNASFGYVGIMNLLPKQPQVLASPLPGSERTVAVPKLYARFDSVEQVRAGNLTLTVEAGSKQLTTTFTLHPFEYLMVYVVDNQGTPELRVVPTPLSEPGEIYARFLNFSSDTGKVTFSRIRTDLTIPGSPERPSTNLSWPFATNLAFGEVRSTQFVNTPNSVYTAYSITGNPNQDDVAPLIIQAYRATKDPFRVGEPLPFTQKNYPFFINAPTQAVDSYQGNRGEPGTYSVILSGISGAGPEERPKITVVCHSF